MNPKTSSRGGLFSFINLNPKTKSRGGLFFQISENKNASPRMCFSIHIVLEEKNFDSEFF